MIPTLNFFIELKTPEESNTAVGENPVVVADSKPDRFSLFPDDLRIRLFTGEETDFLHKLEIYPFIIE
jgi:hypothetical protein